MIAGWKPSFQLKTNDQKFPTKRQLLHRLQEGLPFDEVTTHVLCIPLELRNQPFNFVIVHRAVSILSRLTASKQTCSSSTGC